MPGSIVQLLTHSLTTLSSVACDLVRLLVLVSQILHHNVTAHPTAEWTLQQFREALPGDHPYRFVIHDRDRIFAAEVDKGLENLGGGVLRTPVRAPKANSVCERLGGSLVGSVATC
jgi:hypothetical protein